jgi:hypothetical protein
MVQMRTSPREQLPREIRNSSSNSSTPRRQKRVSILQIAVTQGLLADEGLSRTVRFQVCGSIGVGV